MSHETLLLVISLCILAYTVLANAYLVIRAVIRVRSRQHFSADPGFEPCSNADLGPGWTDLTADLRNLGFVDRGHWKRTGEAPGVSQVTVMEHPRTLDLVKLMVATAGASSTFALVFETWFEDGAVVGTTNRPKPRNLPLLPQSTALWLPDVQDTNQLYRIHGQLRDVLGSTRKRLSMGNDPAAHLSMVHNRQFRNLVAMGYFYLDEAANVYRHTWKGAFLTTWRVLFLVRALKRAWNYRRSRKLLHELGIGLED
jgi:hypothetical protein